MATNSFWIGYHFEEFRSQVAIRKKNSRPVSVLRECWEADFCYLVRVEARGRTISTQGGVGGGYRGKCYCFREFLLDHTNFFERFFWMTIFCQKFWAGLFFFHANAKRPSKHCTSIVSKNMANSRFLILHCWVMRVPLSWLVPIINDAHRLSRILFQLLHVSLCVDSISLLNLFIILLSLINVLYQGWYLQTKENLVFNIMHGKFWFDGDFFVLCSLFASEELRQYQSLS